MLYAGFGKASFWKTFKTDKRLADELNIRTFIVSDGKTTAAVAVIDLGVMWLTTADAVRKTMAETLKLPLNNCAVFSTQNHCVPGEDGKNFNRKALLKAFAEAVLQAKKDLRPAEFAFTSVKPDPPISFTRRIRYKDLGALTFYNGHRDVKGWPEISHVLKLNIKGFYEGLPYHDHGFVVKGSPKTAYRVPEPPVKVKSPVFLGKPADGLLQGIFFRDAVTKKPIGSVIRFAAHPASSNKIGGSYWSGDFPLYACREAERGFGGRSVFMTGPCGNLVPLLPGKKLAFARRIGRQAARAVLSGLKNAEWENISSPVKVVSLKAASRFRKDIPPTNKKIIAEQLRLEKAILAGAKSGMPLKKIKKMTDRYEMISYNISGSYSWLGIDVKKRIGKKVFRDIFALRLGRYAILGFPGEPFGDYSRILRKLTIGKRLITAEECNGYLSYFPLKKDWPLGSYEVNAALCDSSSEKVLISSGLKALKKLGF